MEARSPFDLRLRGMCQRFCIYPGFLIGAAGGLKVAGMAINQVTNQSKCKTSYAKR